MKLTPFILAAAIALGTAPAVAQAAPGLPDAEIFATSNTATITDARDPRLDDPLTGFGRRVERIVREGGGVPRRSQLLDGVFFSSDLGETTFERSRDFDVDGVSTRELAAIAERVRRRFRQQSVLTFDYLPPLSRRVDAIEVEVPGVDVARVRKALLADPTARERLVGGSVTLDGRLLLVADLADFALVRAFVERVGGKRREAVVRFGNREFVG